MIVRSSNVAGASLALLLALFANSGKIQLAEATPGPLGGLLSGLTGTASAVSGGLSGNAAKSIGSHLNSLNNLGSGLAGAAASALRPDSNPLLSGGLGSGLADAASSMIGLGPGNRLAAAATGSSGLGRALMGALGSTSSGLGAIPGNTLNAAQDITSGFGLGLGATVGDATSHLGLEPAGFSASLASAPNGLGSRAGSDLAPTMMNSLQEPAASAALEAASVASGTSAVAGSSAISGEMLARDSPVLPSGGALAAASTIAAASNAALAASAASSSPAAGRADIALNAMRNAQNEAALAGSEMVVNGANNARSASMASNAYRNAKLASARDRVNIAGTIQNAARISDATIATHDAATKAEDSLLGSELAVDSAATVLDSDGAYIPPVTSSLLRSLPYGRLALRNIVPRPLAHPSQNLPDVWLNGFPVRYSNIPLRFYPPIMFGYGPINAAASVYDGATGGVHFMQPFQTYNGMPLNGMLFDPAYAYLSTNLEGVLGTSALPILVNGQLEAQDEVAMANLLQMQQLNGVGMSTTYQGYGRLNPVPMITGSVTDANLMPTTTIGTTYPIGSALVIEPRDSFFQDYNDNASSRQNMDERQQ